MNIKIRVGKFLGIVEHQWADGNQVQHELNLVFRVYPGEADLNSEIIPQEPHLQFEWLPLCHSQEVN